MAAVTALVGCIIMGMVIAGWFIRDLHIGFRILLVPCSSALLISGPESLMANAIGLAGAMAVIGVNYMIRKNLIIVDVARESTFDD